MANVVKHISPSGSRQFDTEDRASMRNVISRAGEKLVHLSNPSRELARISRIEHRYSAEYFLFEMLHAVVVSAGKGGSGRRGGVGVSKGGEGGWG